MNKNSASIYTAGLFQGIALVAFPAVSTILMGPGEFHLSSTAYGSLFIPQALFSILAAALNPILCRRFSTKEVFLWGLFANFLSMALLATSTSYWMLLMATGCLGIGFGMVVPTINYMAEELYPEKSDSAVLTLNALLGVGTALSPLFVLFFTSLGFWRGLPLFLSLALIALALYSHTLDFPEEKVPSHDKQKWDLNLVGIFAVFAFLYGIIETLNGNWVLLYMSKHIDAPIQVQSLALTSFWGMVTFGRIFFAWMSKFFSEKIAFQIAPFVSGIAFILIASLTSGQEYWAIAAFGLTGFSCSILLPLIISFGGKELKRMAASVPGMIISSYLLGYGVAAFGVGPLEEFGQFSLRAIYVMGAILSFILGLLSLYIIQRKKVES